MPKINYNKIHKFYSEAYIYARRQDKSMQKAYSYYVNESVNSPCAAKIFAKFLNKNIRKQFLLNAVERANVEGLRVLLGHFKSNLAGSINMLYLSMNKFYSEKIANTYRKLYPKTENVRKYLINRKRIVYNAIVPVSNRNRTDSFISRLLFKN